MRAALAIVLTFALAAPAAAQQRAIAPTEPPSLTLNLTNPIGTTGVRCPTCVDEKRTSRVYPGGCMSTLLGAIAYYDEEGRYHYHDPNSTSCAMRCSNGHEWVDVSRHACWCEKPSSLLHVEAGAPETKDFKGSTFAPLAPPPLPWIPAPVRRPRVDPWVAAKVAGTIGVVAASLYDYRASNRAIDARRAGELNPLVRGRDGRVNPWAKFGLTAGQQTAGWVLFLKGHRWAALVADGATAALYYGLARRANRIGR